MATAINSYGNETPTDNDKVLGTDATDNGTHNFLFSEIKTYVNTFGTPAGVITSNTLDDYEEGTWTIIPENVPVGVTVTESYANYTKVGNLVHVFGAFSVSSTSSAFGMRLDEAQLPYVISEGRPPGVSLSTNGNEFITEINTASILFKPTDQSSNGTWADHSGGTTHFQITYQTN